MFDDFMSQLRDLQRKIERLDGQHTIPFDELFSDEFMLRYTEFSSIGQMLEASGYKVESTGDFAAVPEDEWDEFVRDRTRFASWEEMKSTAAQQWANRQLGME